jgi:hypothetical protein
VSVMLQQLVRRAGGRAGRVPARLPARHRGHRLEAQGFAPSAGRTLDWIKCKNPDSPAVKREAEEDWGNALKSRARVNCRGR